MFTLERPCIDGCIATLVVVIRLQKIPSISTRDVAKWVALKRERETLLQTLQDDGMDVTASIYALILSLFALYNSLIYFPGFPIDVKDCCSGSLSFVIPPTQPTVLNSRLLRISYYVQIEAKMAWTSNIQLILPVVIGTVPYFSAGKIKVWVEQSLRG